MDYSEGYKTGFQKLANSEGLGLQGLDDLTWNDPLQAMESENEELNNLMSQQRTKEQNNEDLGQLENETETNVAME